MNYENKSQIKDRTSYLKLWIKKANNRKTIRFIKYLSEKMISDSPRNLKSTARSEHRKIIKLANSKYKKLRA